MKDNYEEEYSMIECMQVHVVRSFLFLNRVTNSMLSIAANKFLNTFINVVSD